MGDGTVQNPGPDDSDTDKSLNRQYDYTVTAQIRREGRRLCASGLAWSFVVGILVTLGVTDTLLAFMQRIPILGLLIWIPAMAILIAGPYFLIVGMYQWVLGVRTVAAKKIFGELRFDKKALSDIKPPVISKEAKDTHLSHEFCPFCGGSNISKPAMKSYSSAGALECDACGAIWSPPWSKKFSVFVIAVCVALLPCVILVAIWLYKSELPLFSIVGGGLFALGFLGVIAYSNIMVLKGKQGQFTVHRQP